jgi:hypothetical protein
MCWSSLKLIEADINAERSIGHIELSPHNLRTARLKGSAFCCSREERAMRGTFDAPD